MVEAKAYLSRIRLYDTHINNKLEELQRIRNLATKITTTLKSDVVSTSGNMDKIGDAVAKIVDLEAEINQAIDEYVDLKREVSAVINQITDSDLLDVLQKRYLLYEPWEQIACEMGYTYRNICYLHGKALQAVSDLLAEK